MGEPASASILVEIQCKILYIVARNLYIALCFPRTRNMESLVQRKGYFIKHNNIDNNISDPPEIQMDQQWLIINKTITVKIDCNVYGNPSAQVVKLIFIKYSNRNQWFQVTWFRNKGKIFETDKVLMTRKLSTWSLKLSHLTYKDFGNYSCQATNILGTRQGYSPVTGKHFREQLS